MRNPFTFIPRTLMSTRRSFVPVAKGKTLDMSRDEVRKCIIEQMHPSSSAAVIINDRDYIALSQKRLKTFLLLDGTNNLVYTPEVFDCDDFTRTLLGHIAENVAVFGGHGKRGVAIGEVQGQIYKNSDTPVSHSMCIVIVNDKGEPKIKLLEPQNDKFYDLDERNLYWSIHV